MDDLLIKALLQPTPYEQPTTTVSLLQTHISFIFLTDSHVYKIKKAVDFGFLDFTTLEKRRFYCFEELRLNRRLSPDIYLGVVELRRAPDGNVAFNGSGEVIEYAVKMLRLPGERMMGRLLEEHRVTPADIRAIALQVARFHGDAARSPEIDRFGTVEMIRANWNENLRQVRPYIDRTISPAAFSQIEALMATQLEERGPLINSRITGGFIRECDGDLHSENICLDSRVHIFDCIEFNEKFRYSDTAADVAFLLMDLENHGQRQLAELFLAEYGAASNDSAIVEAVQLYLPVRAFIRGKVESFRLDDPAISAAEKQAAAARAGRFFRLAHGYVLRAKLPRSLFITCAPTGCGKSALAGELSLMLGIAHVATDIERKRLAGIPSTERGENIYTREWHQRTYDRVAELARERLAGNESVLVDGTFCRKNDRDRFAALARESGSRLVILRLNCPPEVVRQRLAARQQEQAAVSDGTWEVYQHQVATMVEPTAAEGVLLQLDATLPPEELAEQCLKSLAGQA